MVMQMRTASAQPSQMGLMRSKRNCSSWAKNSDKEHELGLPYGSYKLLNRSVTSSLCLMVCPFVRLNHNNVLNWNTAGSSCRTPRRSSRNPALTLRRIGVRPGSAFLGTPSLKTCAITAERRGTAPVLRRHNRAAFDTYY